MAYNREIYSKLKSQYAQKNLAAKNAAEARSMALCFAHPELAAIDRELSLTGVKLLKAAADRSELDGLKAEIEALRAKKTAYLVSLGYPEDYLDAHYECDACMDTGFVDGGMCACFKRALTMESYERSGIGALIKRQSFDNFSFEYYKGDAKALEQMKQNYTAMYEYARSFELDRTRNLLLMGGTGMGKTHLSTAVAKEIIDRGFDVCYESAPNVFFDFEHERFARDDAERKCDRYFDSELLIIDDLGTESVTQYSVACLYNVINTRINRGLSTIINTNLTPELLYKKYTDRIASRFLGEYTILHFVGTDIRMQKLRGGVQ